MRFIDLTGQKIGIWTVIKKVKKKNNNDTYFECICENGHKKQVLSTSIKEKRKCRICMDSGSDYLIGKKIGKLTVMEKGPSKLYKNGKQKRTWKCICDCGNIAHVVTQSLRDKTSTSCGCNKRYEDKTEPAIISLLREYKNSAKSRNLEFKLSRKEFENITQGACIYCGCAPSQSTKLYGRGKNKWRIEYIYNGIDRIDNLKGYVSGNVASCCKFCNYSKRNRTKEQFLSWVDKIYEYQHNKKGLL